MEGGLTYTQTFDAENRLISVTVNGQTTQFVYDGYGNLVKKIKPDGSRTIYIGNVYEVDKSSGGAVTRTVTYYPAGGAMRIDGNVYYVLKDRLGSAYATTDASGNVVGEMRYYAFGETRLSTGTMLTDRLYTGQRQIAELGVYHYNARFYSPKLGRFLSADTLMSGFANPQSLNRYSYVGNNPINASDPTGHYCVGDLEGCVDETGAPVNDAPLYLHQDDDGGGGGGNTEEDGKDEVEPGTTFPCEMFNLAISECYGDNAYLRNYNLITTCNVNDSSNPACMFNWLVPTHWGIRLQGEIGANAPLFGPIGPGFNLSGDAQWLYNRYSDQMTLNVDWAFQGTIGLAGFAGILTGGPVVGFGATDLRPIVSTPSEGIVGGSAAYVAAVSGSANVNSVDPISGLNPVTFYGGAGFGGPGKVAAGGGGFNDKFGGSWPLWWEVFEP